MNQTATLRAGVYGRESHDKSKSVGDQLTEAERVCVQEDWPIAGRYKDGSSASRFATKVRKDWAQLVADTAAGKLDVIVIWESSRGSREVIEWFTWLAICRERGVLIHVISHDRAYDVRKARDWRVLADDGVDAAFESEKTRDRVLRGVASAAVAGLPHGNVPYGFRRLYDPETKELVEQVADPETAPIVVEIITRISRADPIVAVQGDLNTRGVPTMKGGPWQRNVIRRIARNPAYVGLRTHKGKLHKATWEPLVKPELWRAAQRVLDQPDRVKTKPGRQQYLASYIALAPCGKLMNLQPEYGGRRDRYHCVSDGCCTIGQWELDEVLSALTVERIAEPDVRNLFKPDGEDVERAREELASLEQELKAARESFYKPNGISPEALAGKERTLAPLIEQAKAKLISTEAPPGWDELMDAAEFSETRVRPAFDGLPMPARRTIIKTLFEWVAVRKAIRRLSRWSTDEERLALAVERVAYQWREFGVRTS